MSDRLIFLLAGILSGAVAFLLLYLFGWFVSQEWDVREWSEAARSLLAGGSVTLGCAWVVWNNRGS